jgi:hypothetical protein
VPRTGAAHPLTFSFDKELPKLIDSRHPSFTVRCRHELIVFPARFVFHVVDFVAHGVERVMSKLDFRDVGGSPDPLLFLCRHQREVSRANAATTEDWAK